MRSGGAALLPTSLLQWLINSFVPSRVKAAITELLPPELHQLLCTGNHMSIGGSLSMYGIPLDVLDCELKMGKNMSSKEVSNTFRDDAHRSALRLLMCSDEEVTMVRKFFFLNDFQLQTED